MKLARADLELLADFTNAARDAGVPCLLVGAGARLLTVDLPWDIVGARATLDWDFAVRVESWAGWRTLRDQLVRGAGARFQLTSSEHRLLHASGSVLDVVPYGGVEERSGDIVWPDGARMSVRGFAESERRGAALEVAQGLVVHVASIPSLALLKLHAYQERRVRGVWKDIQDFDWLLQNYERAGNTDRVYAELSEMLVTDMVDYAEAGAVLLGRDVVAVHSLETIDPIRALIAEGEDPYSRLVQDVHQGRRSADDDRDLEQRSSVCRRVKAFGLGLAMYGPNNLERDRP